MDARERFFDPQEAQRIAADRLRGQLWTALPGIVQSWDAAANTVVVQPAIKAVAQGADGTYSGVDLPLLPDVPVVFPHGGGGTLTFPLAPGDEVLVVFSARCIDAWWQQGGVQYPMMPRTHDLSDGFAIPGPMSQPKRIAGISATEVQLRSDDGQASVAINPASHAVTVTTSGAATVTAGGAVQITGASITLNGPVQINGTLNTSGAITAPAVTGGGKSLSTHTHGGVQTGGGTTGAPT